MTNCFSYLLTYLLICVVLKEAASIAINDESTADLWLPSIAAVTSSKLNDEELVSLPATELNRRLKSVSIKERLRLKKLRRTLKNRHYAQTCRARRINNKCALQRTADALMAEVSALKHQVRTLTAERDHFRQRYEAVSRAYTSGYNAVIAAKPVD